MQTTNPRSISLEVPQKMSPTKPPTARRIKPQGSDSDSLSSPNSSGRIPKSRSPKVADRVSPRSTGVEKKQSKILELESQLALLQDELKKVKDQLISTEKQKRQAQQEAEKTEKQLASMSAKQEKPQQQLLVLSAPEESRFHELHNAYQDLDQVWQLKLEALERQHSLDSAALASARNEIHQLERRLEQVVDSEGKQSRHAESAYAAVQSLRLELSETLLLLEEMKHQLTDCKASKARAVEAASEAQQQLEALKATAETLRSDGLKTMEAYQNLAVELEQSKAQASSLEMLVNKFQEDLANKSFTQTPYHGDEYEVGNQEKGSVRAEIQSLEMEVDRLKSALEASENRYRKEYIQSTLEIREALAEVECAKAESAAREAQLKFKLRTANSAIKELKSELMSKKKKNRTDLMESEPEAEHRMLEAHLEELKASLIDKETLLQSINEENVMLRTEIKERDSEKSKSSEEEALMKLGYATEEADKGNRKAAQIAEQLDAAQTVNTELEAELRRLKVQTDQWRKAAETAAAMLSPKRNGKCVERHASFDSSYDTISAKMDSPFSDDTEDDKKKNGNMLKKIGIFLKKSNKEKHHL
ncbi:hypothetical protein Droror1_Dr00008739 [Drosera rotundifolia]